MTPRDPIRRPRGDDDRFGPPAHPTDGRRPPPRR
jgi:hypothetical protein